MQMFDHLFAWNIKTISVDIEINYYLIKKNPNIEKDKSIEEIIWSQ